MESNNKTVIFEGGSTNTIGVVQAENYYASPNEIVDTLLKVQETLSVVINHLQNNKS